MKRGLPEDGTALPPMAVEGSTILIVDDSSDSRYLLSSLLEGNGFRVLSAPNGAEALKLAREQRPDLVISDILMPIMDGFELCRRWRGDESLRAVPFVFHTATYTEPEDESLGRELGADRFLMKPQQPERLLEVVNEVLEETRTRDTSADGSRAEERELLLQHNQVLFRKLQKKIEDLEQQIAERDRLEQERKRAEEERERLRDQLVVSQKMEAIGRLAGGVAHDFNNLLLVISSYTDMTSGSLPEDHTLQSNLSEIAKAADRAAALTRQLLAFSRRQMLEPRAVDLGALVRGMRSMMGRLLGEDIDVAVREPSEPLVTLGDPGQLEQVVMNLAVNARDAMPRGGKLTIEIQSALQDDLRTIPAFDPEAEHDGFIRLSISDTGCGMDSSTLQCIFEPFFTTKEKGTGLGLATVHGIVKQSGGEIAVSSAKGEGTTFHVYLPRFAGEEAEKERVKAQAPAAGGRETVLVVEDQAPVLELVRRILERAGYRVLTAANAADALRLVEGRLSDIDLLLTDVVMPGMSGYRLAEELVGRHPDLSVLFMSGYAGETLSQRGFEERGADFIAKPFKGDDLCRKVREMLDATARTTRSVP